MRDSAFKYLNIFGLSTWLTIFALIPIALIIAISFLTHTDSQFYTLPVTLSSYQKLLDPIYLNIIWRSIKLATIVTLFTLVIAFPFAYILATSKTKHKGLLLCLMIIPFWTSSLVRTYAIIAIIKTKGLINTALIALGIINHPLQLLYTQAAVVIGLSYNLLPFMILPLYAHLEKFDTRLITAAKDLGANNWQVISKIILPLSKPGITAGCILVFLPAMTLFYIPNILGGARSILLGNVITQQFLTQHDWPMGSATSVALTALLILFSLIYLKTKRGEKS